MVFDFIKNFNLPDKSGQHINFVTIDKLDNFDNLEGLIFFATQINRTQFQFLSARGATHTWEKVKKRIDENESK